MLVDDHAIVRRGLTLLINESVDLEVCGEAADAETAMESLAHVSPDVAVVDWSLGNLDSEQLIREMRKKCPDMPILVLSIHDEIHYADRVLQAGANGYLMKHEATVRILEAIREIGTSNPYLSPRAAQRAWATRASVWRALQGPESVDFEGLLVSVIIPVYNSEGGLGQLADSLIQEMSGRYRLQLILVDDGSRDRSAMVCREIHLRYPEVVDFLELSRNFGEQCAVMAGMKFAKGEFWVIMDDDWQNPPDEVWRLLDEIQKGYEVVYAKYLTEQKTLFRRAGSWVFNRAAIAAFGKPEDLYLSSFKAISRNLGAEILNYAGPHPHVDALVLRTTRRIGVVNVRHDPRRLGRSGYTPVKLLRLWFNTMVAFSSLPVRMLSGLAIAAILVHAALVILSSVLGVSSVQAENLLGLGIRLTNAIGNLLIVVTLWLLGEYAGLLKLILDRSPQFVIKSSSLRCDQRS